MSQEWQNGGRFPRTDLHGGSSRAPLAKEELGFQFHDHVMGLIMKAGLGGMTASVQLAFLQASFAWGHMLAQERSPLSIPSLLKGGVLDSAEWRFSSV